MSLKRMLVALLLLVILLAAGAFGMMMIQSNRMKGRDFAAVSPAGLPDGLYRGSASAVLVSARAEVDLQGGRIQAVRLTEHRHGPGYGAEALCERIVQENRVDVDSISGATTSSLVVKSAVLAALEGGSKP